LNVAVLAGSDRGDKSDAVGRRPGRV